MGQLLSIAASTACAERCGRCWCCSGCLTVITRGLQVEESICISSVGFDGQQLRAIHVTIMSLIILLSLWLGAWLR